MRRMSDKVATVSKNVGNRVAINKTSIPSRNETFVRYRQKEGVDRANTEVCIRSFGRLYPSLQVI